MTTSLSNQMDFDRVIEVHEDGTVTFPTGIYAPEVYDDHVEAPWTLMNGYSGQHGYAGPTMHASEQIGGRLATDILATPGYYVAVVSLDSDVDEGEGDDVAGWCIATRLV
jgi:hypothetical protein